MTVQAAPRQATKRVRNIRADDGSAGLTSKRARRSPGSHEQIMERSPPYLSKTTAHVDGVNAQILKTPLTLHTSMYELVKHTHTQTGAQAKDQPEAYTKHTKMTRSPKP